MPLPPVLYHGASPAKKPAKSKPSPQPPKRKDDTTVLTYELVGEDMSFVVRASDTLWHLCDLVNNEWMSTFRGEDYGVDEHLWEFNDSATRKRYGSQGDDRMFSELLAGGHTVGSKLNLMYDYGSTTEAVLELVSVKKATPDEAIKCPSRLVTARTPANFAGLHAPPDGTPTVDEMYPGLSRALFGTGTGRSHQPGRVGLFPPGRKKHHAVVSTPGHNLVVWIPEPMESVEELMEGLEQGVKARPADKFSWEGRVVVPAKTLGGAAEERLAKIQERGAPLYEVEYDGSQDGYFALAFPKVHKAYTSKKGSERGWINYKTGLLQACRGSSVTPKPRNAPDVIVALDHYTPAAESVLGSIQKPVTSLHELFCYAEALFP
jgi:hypothetical protein